MSGAVRVIKLGGSLLDWPELSASFRRWLSSQAPAANVVVVGGGALVDALRRLDERVSPEAAHWLSIRAMSLTAAMLAELLGETPPIKALAEVRRNESAGVQIFEVEPFLREDARGHDPLPCDWSVTSDSIAARVAVTLAARELVLLKSTLPTAPLSREALARSGFVDAYFPRAAAGLAVRCVDLRNSEYPERMLE
jgi:5-(aminomethyl)-3-furanmethanol phosphate kinase